MTSTNSIDHLSKRQKVSDVDSPSSLSSSVFLGQIHRQHPIQLFEWRPNSSLLPLTQTLFTCITPTFPINSIPSSALPSISSPILSCEPFVPSPLPTLSAKQIILTHKQCLPQDELPESFLETLNDDSIGKIILAVQFIPFFSSLSSSISTESSLSSNSTSIDNNSINNNNNNTDIHTDTKPYTTHILGCIVTLVMQYWSRFEGTEFQFERINNVLSIFVSPTVRRCGLARALLDASYHEYKVPSPLAPSSVSIITSQPGLLSEQKVLPLIPSCRKKLGEIALEVRATNTSAQKLYKSCGFTVQREEKGYYPVGHSVKDRTCLEMVVKFDAYKFKTNTEGVLNHSNILCDGAQDDNEKGEKGEKP